MNSAVASLVYAATEGILGAGGVAGCTPERAAALQRRAIAALAVTRPECSRSPVDGPAPGALVDREVTVNSFVDHLIAGDPFTHLRYGGGEWLSMLGTYGTNGDGHDFFPGTLGRELCESLDYVARLAPDNENVYVGLHTARLQNEIRAYLRRWGLADRVHWVGDILFQIGFRDFSTKRFLEVVRDYQGPKYLVANRWLAPVAQGLGCKHVAIPERDCYLRIGRAERACRFRGPGIVLCAASMAAECLIYRLHRRNAAGTYVDCGHVFDAMLLRPNRRYTVENLDGILELLKEHYAPMFSSGQTR